MQNFSFLNQKLSNTQLNLIDTQLYATGSKSMQNFSFLNQKLSNTQLNFEPEAK